MMSLRRLSCCLVGFMVISLAVSNLHAQRGGGRFGGGFGGFGGFGGGGSLELLAREDVQKELELLDDQIAEIEEAREDQRDAVREAFSGFGRGGNRGGGDRGARGNRDRQGGGDRGQRQGGEDRFARFREMREKMEKQVKESIDKILLPHQSKRLTQLVLQRSLRGGAAQAAAALSSGDLAEDLNVSESQGEKLQEKARSIEEKLRKEIAKLRQKAQEELVSSLTPAQQREFKEMVGKPFTFAEPERGRGRGRGRDRGRGGDRGRGRGGDRSERPRRPNDA